MFSSPSTTLPLSSEGKIRVLAVAGPRRDPNAPDVPTLAESGLPGFESNTWFALMAPSKVPPDVLAKISTDVAQAMRSPTVLKRIETQIDPGRQHLGRIPEGHPLGLRDIRTGHRQREVTRRTSR